MTQQLKIQNKRKISQPTVSDRDRDWQLQQINRFIDTIKQEREAYEAMELGSMFAVLH